MNKVYVVLREEDWFYDDKYSYINVFNSLESAKTYLEEYSEIFLSKLEDEYGGDFYDDVEINKYNIDNAVTIYMEDSYYIRISIEEHDVMSME
jgi:hypothetical protein